jgi:hypothetical protein
MEHNQLRLDPDRCVRLPIHLVYANLDTRWREKDVDLPMELIIIVLQVVPMGSYLPAISASNENPLYVLQEQNCME